MNATPSIPVTRSHLVGMLTCLLLVASVEVTYSQVTIPPQPDRFVQDNVLHSTALPDIRVKVDDAFRYLGKFEFTLKGIAFGERHVFVDETDGEVNRLFIFQFEGFLPDNEHTYRYDFSRGEDIAGFRFRQNTWAYSNEEALQKDPLAEGGLTANFVRAKGLQLEDELMMSRFLMVPDEARRNEMILFYLENASTTGHPIRSFYDADGNPTPHWRAISKGLTARSRASFTVLD